MVTRRGSAECRTETIGIISEGVHSSSCARHAGGRRYGFSPYRSYNKLKLRPDLQSDTVDLSHNTGLTRLALPSYLPNYRDSHQSTSWIMSTITSSVLQHSDLTYTADQYQPRLPALEWLAFNWGLKKLHVARFVETSIPSEFPEDAPDLRERGISILLVVSLKSFLFLIFLMVSLHRHLLL